MTLPAASAKPGSASILQAAAKAPKPADCAKPVALPTAAKSSSEPLKGGTRAAAWSAGHRQLQPESDSLREVPEAGAEGGAEAGAATKHTIKLNLPQPPQMLGAKIEPEHDDEHGVDGDNPGGGPEVKRQRGPVAGVAESRPIPVIPLPGGPCGARSAALSAHASAARARERAGTWLGGTDGERGWQPTSTGVGPGRSGACPMSPGFEAPIIGPGQSGAACPMSPGFAAMSRSLSPRAPTLSPMSPRLGPLGLSSMTQIPQFELFKMMQVQSKLSVLEAEVDILQSEVQQQKQQLEVVELQSEQMQPFIQEAEAQTPGSGRSGHAWEPAAEMSEMIRALQDAQAQTAADRKADREEIAEIIKGLQSAQETVSEMAMDNAEEMAENRQFNDESRHYVGRSEFIMESAAEELRKLYGVASLLRPLVFELRDRDKRAGKSKGGKGSKDSGKGNKDKGW